MTNTERRLATAIIRLAVIVTEVIGVCIILAANSLNRSAMDKLNAERTKANAIITDLMTLATDQEHATPPGS